MTHIIELAAATPEQLEAAAALIVAAFAEDWPEAWPTIEDAREEITDQLDPERIGCLALAASGAVLGLITGEPLYNGHVWEIGVLAVASDQRRHGLGFQRDAGLRRPERGSRRQRQCRNQR